MRLLRILSGLVREHRRLILILVAVYAALVFLLITLARAPQTEPFGYQIF